MFQSCVFLKKKLCSSLLSFRKETGLGIRGPVEDEGGGVETDPGRLGRRMQGLRGESRPRESDQRTGAQVRSDTPQNRTLTPRRRACGLRLETT